MHTLKNKSRGWTSIKNKTKNGWIFFILCMQYLYNAQLHLSIKSHIKTFETAKLYLLQQRKEEKGIPRHRALTHSSVHDVSLFLKCNLVFHEPHQFWPFNSVWSFWSFLNVKVEASNIWVTDTEKIQATVHLHCVVRKIWLVDFCFNSFYMIYLALHVASNVKQRILN